MIFFLLFAHPSSITRLAKDRFLQTATIELSQFAYKRNDSK